MKVYLVGGAVRDGLLGLPIKDRDWVVVGGSAEELKHQGYRQVGKNFPVFLHPVSNEEYALARTEKKIGHGYTGFSFDASKAVTLEEDLQRRDLTINAIAQDEQGNLIDPYGGHSDLSDKILRHVSDAFVEDPLRVLRTCRFAARFNFDIAPETKALLREIVGSGELSSLPAERVWNECLTALNENHPEVFVQAMRECGALKEILPEVDALFGVPQPPKYHPEIDTGEHTCLALQQAAHHKFSSPVRYAVLVHDVGKGLTDATLLPKHHGHEQAGVPLVDDISRRLKVPKEFRELALSVTKHHLQIHRVKDMRAKKLLVLLESLDAFRRPERLEDILNACFADATGRTGLENNPYPSREYIRHACKAASAVSATTVKEQLGREEDFVLAYRSARERALQQFIDHQEQT